MLDRTRCCVLSGQHILTSLLEGHNNASLWCCSAATKWATIKCFRVWPTRVSSFMLPMPPIFPTNHRMSIPVHIQSTRSKFCHLSISSIETCWARIAPHLSAGSRPAWWIFRRRSPQEWRARAWGSQTSSRTLNRNVLWSQQSKFRIKVPLQVQAPYWCCHIEDMMKKSSVKTLEPRISVQLLHQNQKLSCVLHLSNHLCSLLLRCSSKGQNTAHQAREGLRGHSWINAKTCF